MQETTQLTGGRGSLKQPPLESVNTLLRSTPQPVDPSHNETLENYLSDLEETDQALSGWLGKFAEVTQELQREVARWKKLPLDLQLGKELAELESMAASLDTLGALLDVHDRLVDIGRSIRSYLKKELSEEEGQVLDTILEQHSCGRDRISVVELADSLQTPNCLDALLRLAEKNLIRLEVVVQ